MSAPAAAGKADAKKQDKKKDAKKADKKADAKAAAPAKADAKAAAPAKAAHHEAAKPAHHDAKAPAAGAAAPAKPAAAHAEAKKPAAAAKPKAAKPTEAKAKAAAPAAHHDAKAPFNKKIAKAKGAAPSELEQSVARALHELETSTKDLTAELTDLYIVAAKEVGVDAAKKAIVVFVPYRQHSKYKKIQARLIRELEKKLGRHVAIVAQRTILSKNYGRAHAGQIRPRSRTLTSVHNAILEDLVYPTLIVGKRMRVKLDGSRLIKVHLDPKDVKEVDHKLKTFSSVYAALTNKKVEFVFPLGDE